MGSYLKGVDAIGALGLPTAPGADPYIAIRVRNVGGLVERRGGSTGGLAFQLVPQTITNTVYSEMAKKIASGFQSEGVDADVRVVQSSFSGVPHSPRDLVTGVAIGAGAVLALKVLLSLFRRK